MFLTPALAALVLGQTGTFKPYSLAPGFKVSLPGAPVLLKLGPAQKEIESSTWFVKLSEGAFIVTVAKSSSAEAGWPPKRILANFLAGYLHSSHSDATYKREVTLNGWPGAEMKTKSASGITSHMRVYAANGTIYQVVAASAPGAKALPKTQAVLNSISLSVARK